MLWLIKSEKQADTVKYGVIFRGSPSEHFYKTESSNHSLQHFDRQLRDKDTVGYIHH